MSKLIPKFTWSSSKENLVEKFYRPALADAVLYQRKSGYFSSTSFAEISKEIIDLIKSKGRIQLITSPNLSTFDKSILEKSVEDRDKMLSEIFFDDLVNDPTGTKQHFAKLMAYMLTNQIDGKPQLEIKIALTNDGQGIFHDKTGIIHRSDGEMICFTGSNNETSSGWSTNVESFVAFFSWIDKKERDQAKELEKEFENIWNQNNSNVRIFDLPIAIKEHLLKISPKSTIEYQDTFKKVCEIIGEPKEKGDENEKEEKGLRTYQKVAIEEWMKNGSRGIFAMATGTGKTYNALGCLNKILKEHKRMVTIIACPQTHLVEQWKRALLEYNQEMPEDYQINVDRTIICYGEKEWRNPLDDILYDFNKKTFSGKYVISNFIIFVTHATLNSDDFKKYIDKITNSKILLVVDEVHNIGSKLSLNALLDKYDYRLGLSATPMRHYDKEGSDALMKYFEKIAYEYDLKDAVKDGWLCGYDYWPIYAELTYDEMQKHHKLTMKIAASMQNKNLKKDEDDENNPANLRANLIGNAENKLEKLQEILIKKNWTLKQTLIYCTSNPSPNLPFGSKTQLENVNDLISNHHFTVKSITYHDATKDRGEILNNLARGHYDCITAVQCLDEGTDIPSVETAIIMASSGNPKQYIQRRGRVLRQSKKTGKTKAVIYDILVKPPRYEDEEIQARERKIVARELLRHHEFAEIALNKDKAYEIIKETADYYKIDIKKLKEPDYINSLE